LINLTEQQLRNNEPIELFVVDGRPVKVKLLGSVQAEKWISSAREIGDLNSTIQTLTEAAQRARARLSAAEDAEGGDEARDKAVVDIKEFEDKLIRTQADRALRMRACMHDYDPSVLTEDVIAAASYPQLEGAFQLLSTYNDPLSCLIFSRMEITKMMKSKAADILGGMKS
jgi:hypothetical protein